MLLDIDVHGFEKDIIPYIKNGIILDTSVIKIFIDGFIATRFSKKPIKDIPEYNQLLVFFDLIKINGQFDKFLITPHILTEVCNHFRNDYGKTYKKEIFEEVMPFLCGMSEANVGKNRIFDRLNIIKPIEIGDLSICVLTDDFIGEKNKITILAKDAGLNANYKDHPTVMVMDFQSIYYSLL